MTVEKQPIDTRTEISEIERIANELQGLSREGLGLWGIMYKPSRDGKSDFIMAVEEGLPDEFKEILAGAAEGVTVKFIELHEPKPQSDIPAFLR